MSGLVSLVTPLMSALVAGVVAWLVTLRQGRTARHSWVLDKRFGVYQEVFEAFLAVVRRSHDLGVGSKGASLQQTFTDVETRTRMLAALTTPELIAPAQVRQQLDLCITLMWNAVETGETEFIVEMQRLFALMREDLVPKSLR